MLNYVILMLFPPLRPPPPNSATFYLSGAESELCVTIAKFEYSMEQVLHCSWVVVW